MLARALIVVLIALNLGVAAWWVSRPAALPPPAPVSGKGGVELRLAPADAPLAGAPQATVDPVAAVQEGEAESVAWEAPSCLRIGPFAERAAAEAARAGLGGALQDPQLSEEPARASRYRVLLPPAADRAEAQATAARIAAAGFDDLFILNQGQEANGIALGAYGNSDAAQRRAAALRAAGFPVEVQPVGATSASRWWVLGTSDDPAAVRRAFPAAQEQDCAALPEPALR